MLSVHETHITWHLTSLMLPGDSNKHRRHEELINRKQFLTHKWISPTSTAENDPLFIKPLTADMFLNVTPSSLIQPRTELQVINQSVNVLIQSWNVMEHGHIMLGCKYWMLPHSVALESFIRIYNEMWEHDDVKELHGSSVIRFIHLKLFVTPATEARLNRFYSSLWSPLWVLKLHMLTLMFIHLRWLFVIVSSSHLISPVTYSPDRNFHTNESAPLPPHEEASAETLRSYSSVSLLGNPLSFDLMTARSAVSRHHKRLHQTFSLSLASFTACAIQYLKNFIDLFFLLATNKAWPRGWERMF